MALGGCNNSETNPQYVAPTIWERIVAAALAVLMLALAIGWNRRYKKVTAKIDEVMQCQLEMQEEITKCFCDVKFQQIKSSLDCALGFTVPGVTKDTLGEWSFESANVYAKFEKAERRLFNEICTFDSNPCETEWRAAQMASATDTAYADYRYQLRRRETMEQTRLQTLSRAKGLARMDIAPIFQHKNNALQALSSLQAQASAGLNGAGTGIGYAIGLAAPRIGVGGGAG